uniref:mannosyl-oligosaccharide 1,3-1,6-alpha-mannosidase n=1 Tax=Strongyloides stercoralis TaxID=6248 RepID=A0A0K0DY09_STRER
MQKIEEDVIKLKNDADIQINKLREEIKNDKKIINQYKEKILELEDEVKKKSKINYENNIVKPIIDKQKNQVIEEKLKSMKKKIKEEQNVLKEPKIINEISSIKSSTKSCKMDIKKLFSSNNNDVQMLNVYETIPFSNIDGGVWRQGWDITYDKKNILFEPKLRVFVVPHSHNDPGWLKTFENYYNDQVDFILSTVTDFIIKNDDMRFIYAEMSFLEKYWDKKNSTEREKIKQLVKDGKIEIVTGGWVMTDEANSHYFAQIMELFEGHEFLKNHFDNYKPKNHWSIDPFGLSPTMAYLLKKSNLTSMAIQRVHYEVKKYLAEKKQLEFNWRQLWDNDEGKTDIFTSLFPFFSYDIPHTCGPDPSICCQFDFLRMLKYGCDWKINPVKIISKNIKERAQLLVDQYRKKSTLFKYNTLLVPLGDDFRYETKEEISIQYDNYKKLFDYINSPEGVKTFNMEVKFGTLKDYFDEVNKKLSKETATILTGDFFTYADHDDHYWSGYYTSRPFYKKLDRLVQHYLRGADLLYSTSIMRYSKNTNLLENYKNKVNYSLLVEGRRYMSLFQHHDGVTGTAKSFVMNDYSGKMLKAIENCFTIIQNSIEFFLKNIKNKKYEINGSENIKNNDVIKLTVNEYMESSDTLPSSYVINQNTSIILYNPLSREVDEIICLKINSYEMRIKNVKEKDQEIRPIIEVTDNHFIFSYSSSNQNRKKNFYELCFKANIGPLDIKIYDLIKKRLPKECFVKINGSDINVKTIDITENYLKDDEGNYIFDIDRVIKNNEGHIDLKFNSVSISINDKTGFLSHINNEIVETSFSKYGVRSPIHSKPGGEVVSGAYLFLPDGPSTKISSDDNSYIILDGNLKKTVIVKGNRQTYLFHKTEIIKDKLYVSVKNEIGIMDLFDFEMAMEIKSEINSEDIFYTDLNGYQVIRRKRFDDKIPLQGNFYPMPSTIYIEDSKKKGKRLSLIGNQPLGCSSLSSGKMEVILDRRLTQDDSRGLASGVLDNVKTRSSFRIILEEIEKEELFNNSPTGFLSKVSQLTNQQMHYQPIILFSNNLLNINNKEILSNNFSPLKESLPCDYHVVGMRAETKKCDYDKRENGGIVYNSENSIGLILQRYAFDCSLTYQKKQKEDKCFESEGELNLKEKINLISGKIFNSSLTMMLYIEAFIYYCFIIKLVDSKDRPNFEDLLDAIDECDLLVNFGSLLDFNESISGHDEWHVSYLKFLNLRLDFYYFQHSLELRTYRNLHYDPDGTKKKVAQKKLCRVIDDMDSSIVTLFPNINSGIKNLTNSNTEEYINKLRQEIIKICSTDRKIFNKVVFKRHGDPIVQQKEETEDECVAKVKTIFTSSCNREKELMDFCLTVMFKAGRIIEECYGDVDDVVKRIVEIKRNSPSICYYNNSAFPNCTIMAESINVDGDNSKHFFKNSTYQALKKVTQICEVIFAVHKRNYYTQKQLLMELEEKSTSFFVFLCIFVDLIRFIYKFNHY